MILRAVLLVANPLSRDQMSADQDRAALARDPASVPVGAGRVEVAGASDQGSPGRSAEAPLRHLSDAAHLTMATWRSLVTVLPVLAIGLYPQLAHANESCTSAYISDAASHACLNAAELGLSGLS
jgi:hypothetical protein